MANTSAWAEDDVTRSDSLTVLIESDPIAAAAVMKDAPSDMIRAQEELEIHPFKLEYVHHDSSAAHHGNSSVADTKLNSEDTQKLLP